jgi:hypothetical protein
MIKFFKLLALIADSEMWLEIETFLCLAFLSCSLNASYQGHRWRLFTSQSCVYLVFNLCSEMLDSLFPNFTKVNHVHVLAFDPVSGPTIRIFHQILEAIPGEVSFGLWDVWS